MFKLAIVKKPCKNFENGLSDASLGKPDYGKTIQQHQKYVNALKNCGLEIFELESDNNYPDSTFVEDTALLTKKCAIITNPGADSRKGEINSIEKSLRDFYNKIERIKSPGTLDAGDVMMVGDHFYIGLSARTNYEGARQLIYILQKYGMSGSTVQMNEGLHLKSGTSYLENNNMVLSGEFINKPEFQKYNIIAVEEDESYSANCLWINEKVLFAKGFPKTKRKIERLGYEVIELDMSEFRKLDGGLSCLSLRF